MDKTRLLKSSVNVGGRNNCCPCLRFMQSGIPSPMHSILSAFSLRRRICLFWHLRVPDFSGQCSLALLRKSGTINFLKQSTFFNVVPEKTGRDSLNVSDQIAVRAFSQGAENAELHPCDVFSGATHVEDFFFAVNTFFNFEQGTVYGGNRTRDTGIFSPLLYQLSYKFFAVGAFIFAVRSRAGLQLPGWVCTSGIFSRCIKKSNLRESEKLYPAFVKSFCMLSASLKLKNKALVEKICFPFRKAKPIGFRKSDFLAHS